MVCIYLVKLLIYLSLDLSSSYLTLPITLVFLCSFSIILDLFWIDWIYLFILYSFYDVMSSFSVSVCILFRSYLRIKIHILDPSSQMQIHTFTCSLAIQVPKYFNSISSPPTCMPLILCSLVLYIYLPTWHYYFVIDIYLYVSTHFSYHFSYLQSGITGEYLLYFPLI